jgi:hypothetical protein
MTDQTLFDAPAPQDPPLTGPHGRLLWAFKLHRGMREMERWEELIHHQFGQHYKTSTLDAKFRELRAMGHPIASRRVEGKCQFAYGLKEDDK